MLARIGPNRFFGIVGGIAITLILQAYDYGWYIWIPAAIIAYTIAPIFLVRLLLPFWFLIDTRPRAQQQPPPLPLTPEQHVENLKSILGDREAVPDLFDKMPTLSNETIRHTVIAMALTMPEGERRLDDARQYLLRMVERGRFNTERAIEVMTFTVDNAVWADVKRAKDGRRTYRDYKTSGLGLVVGTDLAYRFIAESGARNQRPTRTWFRYLLGA
jgi:hypothetical protein